MRRSPKPSQHAELTRAKSGEIGGPAFVVTGSGAARRRAASDSERFPLERRLLHVNDVTIASIKGQVVPGPVSQGPNAVPPTHELDEV